MKKVKSNLFKFFCMILSFLLSFLLFTLTLLTVAKLTIYKESFILTSMDEANYFIDKKDEIETSLTDLGYASGLKEEFFDGLLNEVMLRDDTANYFKEYYKGNSSVIDKTAFLQTFNEALDKYIVDNNIDPATVNSQSREYLISKAAVIYTKSLKIPLFNKISGYYLGSKKYMPFIIAFNVIMVLLLSAILFFSNKWKHRGVKYMGWACGGAFISTIAIPTYLYFSHLFEKINLDARSNYNLFVTCGNSITSALFSSSIILLLLTIIFYFAFIKLYKKIS